LAVKKQKERAAPVATETRDVSAREEEEQKENRNEKKETGSAREDRGGAKECNDLCEGHEPSTIAWQDAASQRSSRFAANCRYRINRRKVADW